MLCILNALRLVDILFLFLTVDHKVSILYVLAFFPYYMYVQCPLYVLVFSQLHVYATHKPNKPTPVARYINIYSSLSVIAISHLASPKRNDSSFIDVEHLIDVYFFVQE